MSKRTCLQCNQAIPSDRTAAAKYCSTKCGRKVWRDSSVSTCISEDCSKPVRAKRLCATHYNQMHHPNRHAKKLTLCIVCGKQVPKGTGGGRTYGNVCSNECRAELRQQYKGEHSELPKDHWALWYGKASTWPRYPMLDCAHCATAFLPKAANAKYCSRKCTWQWHDNKNGVRSFADTYAQVRSCVRCGDAYQHVSMQRAHCSDFCRDSAATERGAYLHHGWIRKGLREAIYQRDGHTCMLCGEAVDYNADPQRGAWAPTLDHVVPRSKGGTHEASNLRTAHRWCNSVRSDNESHELFELTA